MRRFDIGVQAAAVVVMHLHPEGTRAPRHGLTDPAHAQNAQAPPRDAPAHEGGRRPAFPAAFLHHGHAFGQAAQHGQDQRHRHIGGVIGHHAGRVRHQNAALAGRRHIDMIHACAVIRDQL